MGCSLEVCRFKGKQQALPTASDTFGARVEELNHPEQSQNLNMLHFLYFSYINGAHDFLLSDLMVLCQATEKEPI